MLAPHREQRAARAPALEAPRERALRRLRRVRRLGQHASLEGGGEQVLLPRSEHPVNSGAGETYRDFLLAGMKRFPASHYLVIVGSHGAGADGVVAIGQSVASSDSFAIYR